MQKMQRLRFTDKKLLRVQKHDTRKNSLPVSFTDKKLLRVQKLVLVICQ
ncbi:hypothetical protein D840_02236 [Enterococcus faecalis 20.SD.W.06]|nr:hypothetical protein D840_02236 [Enterococcus faecalis 20.SD.W.06]